MSLEGASSERVRFAILVRTRSTVCSLTDMDRHVHRADLHRGLLECASELGIKTYLDSRVLEIDPTVPLIKTKGGLKLKPDLIVASDGLHSIARHVVVGSPSPPIPTGQMVYRVTVPAKRLE